MSLPGLADVQMPASITHLLTSDPLAFPWRSGSLNSGLAHAGSAGL